MNLTKVSYVFDLLIALIFVGEMEERFTGLAIHEILGVVTVPAFLIDQVPGRARRSLTAVPGTG